MWTEEDRNLLRRLVVAEEGILQEFVRRGGQKGAHLAAHRFLPDEEQRVARERAVLEAVQSAGAATLPMVQAATGLAPESVRSTVARLVEQGRMEAIPGGKKVKIYRVPQ